MSQENTVEEPQTLGTFLRNHRELKGVSLDEATEATKISKRMLEAIENDDYNSLPAETFSRGFYSIYATFLGLDPAEILTRYYQSRGQQPAPRKNHTKPPLKNSKEFSTFAEPASFSSVSTMSIVTVTALVAAAAICWSLNWNPATYISAKLQSLKDKSLPAREQIFESTPQEEPSTMEVEPITPALPPNYPQFNSISPPLPKPQNQRWHWSLPLCQPFPT